jgi:D-alanyl-D-alanine dipeptidase
MKFKPIGFCSIFLAMAAISAAQAPNQAGLSSSTQIIVVTAQDWDKVEGRLQRYEREGTHKKWQPVGGPVTVVLGAKGMGWGLGVEDSSAWHDAADPVKHEGDGKSPAGAFALGKAFGYEEKPDAAWKMPYLSLTPTVECVDDMGSKYYARVVDRSVIENSGASADWHSSEVMRKIEDYKIGVVINHNAGATTGGGSCIFMHIWEGRGVGTHGCTAMPREELEPVIAWLDPAKNPLLVQMPLAQYKKIRKSWKLPKLPKQ